MVCVQRGAVMREQNPDFIEALARGLDVIRSFGPFQREVSLSDLAQATELARPTVRRILITLESLGYVSSADGQFSLTPKVLDLGTAHVASSNIWQLTRPHLTKLVSELDESSSIAQLDGGDVVYVSRVAVPKLVTLSVSIGTRFPAYATSLGKVLLAGVSDEKALEHRHTQSDSGITPSWQPTDDEFLKAIREVRAKGWAMTDQQLAPAIRSVAAPIRNGDGDVVAAINVNTHAMETNEEKLTGLVLPELLETASNISSDWSSWENRSEIDLV